MKTTRFYSLALAALMLGACSDVTELNENQTVATGETGFVKIAINLPTTSGQSTRANHANDQFDDGLEDEYAVNDAYLLVFGGNSESDAVYSGSYKLTTNFQNNDPADDNITSKSEVVQAIKKPTGTNTYALVVLNNNGILKVAGASSGETLTPGTTKLAGLQTKLEKSVSAFIKDEDNKASFTMTNAPIATKSGSGSTTITGQDVSTLVELTLHVTEADAESGTADEIYVERVVAKVTVTNTNGIFVESSGKYTTTIDNDGSYKSDQVTLDAWYLNVTNKSTNFVRDVEDETIPDWENWAVYANSGTNTSDNRFFGYNAPYRVYWAIDHNYNKDWGDVSSGEEERNLNADFYIYEEGAGNQTMGSEGADVFEQTKPAYCLENTFATANMNQKETTAVVLKATYVLSGESAAQTFYVLGLPQEAGETYKKDGLAAAVNAKLTSLTVELKTDIDNLAAGYYDDEADMKSLFKKASGDLSTEEAKQVLEALNCVRVYKNGVSYYGVRIQHFGDTYTKLEGTGVSSASEYNSQQHLGRYGVVRNNWYVINIADITGPGRPTSPDPTDPDDPDNPDPDDPVDNMWIKCNINILSWAKRTQDVSL